MANKHQQQTARGLALTTLDRVLRTGAYSNLQLRNALDHSNLSAEDKRLTTNLVYGTLQHQLTLEYWLASFIKGKKLVSWVQTLLLMTLYEYQYLDRVPNYAATDTAIELAKRRGNPGLRRLVTGVLHAYLRRGPRHFDQIKDPQKRLSISQSLPLWLVQQLTQQYGWAKTRTIATAVNEPAHVSIRVNRRLTTPAQAAQELAVSGVKTRPSDLAGDGLVVTAGDVVHSQALTDGLVTIQDESAMLPVEALHVQPGDVVLDACAAPGGKTVQIAEQLSAKAGGKVFALDLHANKVQLIQRNAARMHVDDVVSAIPMDARDVGSHFPGQTFNRILVDAPCSGFGLLRRKPEIRYARNAQASANLHQIQLAILNAVAAKLVKGGIIIFSTCTIMHQENEGTVKAFLASHPDFSPVRVQTTRLIKDDRRSASLTILPDDFGSDGFFISCLKRN